MATFTGVVESVSRTGKAIKIGERWYSAFTAAQLNGANVGNNVRFVFNETEKAGTTYYNIKGSVSILKDEPAAPSTAALVAGPEAPRPSYAGKGGRSFPVGPLDPERSIIRQNALTQANNAIGLVFRGEEVHSDEELADRLIALARKFEAYSAGDLDAIEAENAVAAMTSSMMPSAF